MNLSPTLAKNSEFVRAVAFGIHKNIKKRGRNSPFLLCDIIYPLKIATALWASRVTQGGIGANLLCHSECSVGISKRATIRRVRSTTARRCSPAVILSECNERGNLKRVIKRSSAKRHCPRVQTRRDNLKMTNQTKFAKHYCTKK